MKRFIVLLLLLFVMATGVFAMDMAIGAGAMYNNTTYSLTDEDGTWTWNAGGFGAFAFFGVSRFFEINLGYINKKDEWDLTMGALMIGVLGKYPFQITESVVLFPSLGVDFEYSLPKWEDMEEDQVWHEVWLRGGLGIDFFATDNFFIRGHFNYGAGLVLGDNYDRYHLSHGLLAKVGIGWMF